MDPRRSAQDLIRCDVCETAIVQAYCESCNTNLCKSCTGDHVFSDLSKNHAISRFNERNSHLVFPKCSSHEEKKCELHCKKCNVPICSLCVVSEHETHKLQNILNVFEFKQAQIKEDRDKLKKTFSPKFKDISIEVKQQVTDIETHYIELIARVRNHGEDWHNAINDIISKLNSKIYKMKNKHLEALKSCEVEIDMQIKKVHQRMETLETILGSNNIPELLEFKSDFENFLKIPHRVCASLPSFSSTAIPNEQLSEWFGSLSVEAGFSLPGKQLLGEPNTVTTIDTGYVTLHNVACLNNEEIWTIGDDQTIKLFSISKGSLLKSITVKTGVTPEDISVSKSGDLIYTDHWNRTVNIVKNEKIEEVIRLQNWRPSGVCSTSSGDVLVSMDSDDHKQSKVVRYSGSKEKQTIQFDDKGMNIYSFGYNDKFISENRNLDICVADCGAKAVVVVNKVGKQRFRYAGHTPTPKDRTFNPRVITTDNLGQILTADDNNDCIHIIDQDGNFLCFIEHGLNEPRGLCTDNNDNLFVAHQGIINQVIKIKYLKYNLSLE